MKLYLIRLTDGINMEVMLVAGRRQSLAHSWASLQAAVMSRMVGVTWRVHSVVDVDEVEVTDDHEARLKVTLG